MGISDKDRKILWARSGNRCALCRRVLVADRTMLDEEAIVGDEAHIAARSPGGPRYGECTPDMVDRYDNFILLCKVDHKKVDDQPRHYTTARLRQSKSEHEAWVEHALGKTPSAIRFHLNNDHTSLSAKRNPRIDLDLPNRVFSVRFGQSAQRFSIPDAYDILVSDMKQIFETAEAVTGVESQHWWGFHHNRRAERDRFTTSRFSLTYAGDLEFGDCYVEWLSDSEGYQRGNGYRGDGSEDTLGGIITDQQMNSISYDLANNEEYAISDGYSLIGDWYIRVLQDEDVDVLVQARISALWTKPRRWTAVPLTE
ncbi:hypothetical protein LZG04_11375 [Saccharothrix sp. S26]|uniref:HNH endonuclease n=1 Tax=Saccharothrix sp. S26 TaxID=2907215 RepID=UPI001F41C5AA|nr:hypothetical protein [Saccharothrix sp. S26]MCE6995404.1 hypothetical protein [Saccharothrix sp. S26]